MRNGLFQAKPITAGDLIEMNSLQLSFTFYTVYNDCQLSFVLKMHPGIPQSQKPLNITNVDPEKQSGRNKSGWEWYDPPQDSLPVKFCLDTSLHGLRYLGQQKRHICERIFWLTAFIAAVTTAAIWIWKMYHAYTTMPIITVFSPSELALKQIPFPAVTICNVNNIQKSKIDELGSKAMKGLGGNLPEDEFLQTLSNYLDIWHICEATKTFTERFAEVQTFDDIILQTMWENRNRYTNFLDPVQTLRNFSQSCSDMIIFCLWLDNQDNCSSLFQEVETDYGYCCTFNTIPLSLLRRREDKYAEMIDDPERVEAWKDADVSMDNLIVGNEDEAESRMYPRRQKCPGRGAGLSILLNPDLDEYYCINTDAEGFMVSVNVPLDFPRIKENGIAVRTNSEVFINVKPEVTMSEDSTKHFSVEKRKCYFDREFELPRYTKYTTSNCVDECIATETNKKCGCMRYFMPHGKDDETMCRPDKYNCTEDVKEKMVANGLEKSCEHCLASCTEILYNTSTTSLPVMKQYTERLFKKFPEFSNATNVSIVHVYFNVDSTYPRLRKEKMSIIELISNAGGLLGLCMGFSMLSMLEVIYHATLRLFCRSYRKRPENSMSGHGDNVSRQIWGNFVDRPNGGGGDDMQKLEYSSNDQNINTGFLRKVFQRNLISSTRTSVKETNEFTGRESDNLPEYFQTPFETDFYKAYVATTALQSPHLVDTHGKS